MPNALARKPRPRRTRTRTPTPAPEQRVEVDSLVLREPEAIRAALEGIDWAFQDADTGYLSHDVHPYPAKFIPQIPEALISHLSLRGELVFDPFGGSGTTALEAVRLGRRALCTDANPIGLLVGRVKTARVNSSVETELRAIKSSVLSAITDRPPLSRMLETYREFIPNIPNREKWFPDESTAELALIRDRIARLKASAARDIATLALSRVVLRASFQDSETRYTAKPRVIPRGDTLAAYAEALEDVATNVAATAAAVRYGVADFVLADTRSLPEDRFPDESVDLIVTSPPYGNAMDYHLYHRFRLFWTGHDPRALAAVEVGSHLRHQRESNGFESFRSEMGLCMSQFARVLRPGRYVAIVIGDSLYEGRQYRGADMIVGLGKEYGLREICTLSRAIHQTKRSFVAAGRRATTESIVVMRKPPVTRTANLDLPPYRLWPYEETLRRREIEQVAHGAVQQRDGSSSVEADPATLSRLRTLTFTHHIRIAGGPTERTWQAILENGFAGSASARKDPKYATHGLHPYKGKFYPQLARSLINISGRPPGSRVLDPFCGSGTTLLEAYLNGYESHGCDMNPLAAKIARAKLGVLEMDPDLFQDAVQTLQQLIATSPRHFADDVDQFTPSAVDEIHSWFPAPVVSKINWLLGTIRTTSSGVLRDYFEVLLSSLIREVSHQEPSDLRIRRRKEPLADADVLGLFTSVLREQAARVERFWTVRGYAPCEFRPATIAEGDSRNSTTLLNAGATVGSVDLVLTSPPYATALPYIDTDRLSLLVLFGLNAAGRRPLEYGLTGSREIARREREQLEEVIRSGETDVIPKSVIEVLRKVQSKMSAGEVGFRRLNTPALLQRFFLDMASVLKNVAAALRPGGDAFIVMGDNSTSNGLETIEVPTARLVGDIARHCGLTAVETIPITVTTENRMHIRHAIRENVVLRMRR